MISPSRPKQPSIRKGGCSDGCCRNVQVARRKRRYHAGNHRRHRQCRQLLARSGRGSLRRHPQGSWPRISQGLCRTGRLPDRRCPDYSGICSQGQACDSRRRPGMARWRQRRTGRFGQLLPAVARAGGRVRASIHRIPAISTGIYGYPLDQATEIAVRTVRDTVRTYPNMELRYGSSVSARRTCTNTRES